MEPLVCAGRPVPDAVDRIRRYCGLAWSGGGPEVWAYAYFDVLPTGPPDELGPVDVLAAAALHPGLSRAELEYFVIARGQLEDWLAGVADVDLANAADDEIAVLRLLPSLTGGLVSLSLLTKVLHRKRPGLIPLCDRAVLDWYRPMTGARGERAWPALIDALQVDTANPNNGLVLATAPAAIRPLRALDIAVWMGATR